VKKVLVILTQANLSSLQVHESLSATMVLATFGCEVKVLLQDAALSLLASDIEFNQIKHAFKVASNMVESFEFYDLTPVLVETKNQSQRWVQTTEQELEFVELNATLIQQFDHVLYW
jgi:sulfur relay (sulfurtransferase) DsrF/TusC family protein